MSVDMKLDYGILIDTANKAKALGVDYVEVARVEDNAVNKKDRFYCVAIANKTGFELYVNKVAKQHGSSAITYTDGFGAVKDSDVLVLYFGRFSGSKNPLLVYRIVGTDVEYVGKIYTESSEVEHSTIVKFKYEQSRLSEASGIGKYSIHCNGRYISISSDAFENKYKYLFNKVHYVITKQTFKSVDVQVACITRANNSSKAAVKDLNRAEIPDTDFRILSLAALMF